MLVGGATVMVCVVCPPGDHKNVEPTLALAIDNLVLSPKQMVLGVADMVGICTPEFAVTV